MALVMRWIIIPKLSEDWTARLGVSSYHNRCKEYEDIDYDITKVEQTLVVIQAIVESVQNQVKYMHLRFGVCIFPLPIVHPSEQVRTRGASY
jgi:hypothetical protein